MSDRGRGRGRARGRGRGQSSVGRGRSNAGRDSTRNDTPPVGGLRASETPQSNPKATPTSPPSVREPPKPETTAPSLPLTPERKSNGPMPQKSPNTSASSGSPSSTGSPSSCISSSLRSSPQSSYSASPITTSSASSSTKLVPSPSFEYRDPPQRPDKGILGRPIVLRTNHFSIKFPRKGELYHYDVTLKPDTCPRKINRLVIREIEKKYSENLKGILLAYDGTKNIYTSKPLPFESKVYNSYL